MMEITKAPDGLIEYAEGAKHGVDTTLPGEPGVRRELFPAPVHTQPNPLVSRRRRYTAFSWRWWRPSKYMPHQGAREKARRLRQKAEGKLKFENGLETA